MINDGYYVIEYNYKDTRGHIRTKRLMRGTFDLVVPIYKDIAKMVKEKNVHRPIARPRFIKVKGSIENEIDFKEEYEEWRNLKLSTKK